MSILKKVKETKKSLSLKNFKPEFAIVAGSGLDSIKNNFNIIKSIKYSKIPNFLNTTTAGHCGELNFCSYKGIDFLLLNGRAHYYEGHLPQEVVYPIRVLKTLGVKKLILTAAVGAINKEYLPGDLVLLTDHINFTGNNPLIGQNEKEFGERFPDMSEIYDKKLRKISQNVAKKNKIKLHEGVYFCVSGPSYETPAEIKAFRKLGGDVIGMSVVYEAIAASHMKMKILGLTYVSNMAAGINKKNLSHNEVLKTGSKTISDFVRIIKDVMENTK